MPATIVTTLVSSFPGGLLLCAFAIVAVLVIGAACNTLIRFKTTGFESVSYAAASGIIAIALMGICVASAGPYRHAAAITLLYGSLGAGLALLVFRRAAHPLFAGCDRWDAVAFGLYLTFVSLCFGISYLPIAFPSTLIDGPYVFKSHRVHVKIQAITGDMPCDNYIPHIVSEYLLRGISFQAERPIVPGQEVSDRPILMSLAVVPFRAALDPPPLQNGPLPKFTYVGRQWPDTSILGDDNIFRQFLAVAIVLNGFIMLAGALFFKRYGSGTVQIIGCLLILISPYFISQTLFTWPKALAAFFVLLAIHSLRSGRSPLLAGLLAGCAYLCHPFAGIYAFALGLYLLCCALKNHSYSVRECCAYGAAFAATLAPWFIWTRLWLKIQPDLLQQNIALNSEPLTIIWVRVHNAYETLGARVFELYPFNADQFVQATILCLPGIIGLLFAAYGYLEAYGSWREKRLIVVVGIAIPVAAIILVFGYPAAAPALHGLQVAGVLLIFLGVLRVTRKHHKRIVWMLVVLQLLLNGSLLCMRASHLNVFGLLAGEAYLAGWPDTSIVTAKVAPNPNVPITIDGEVKNSIWMNAPAVIACRNVRLGKSPVLLVSLAIHPHVWDEMGGDGAVFQVEISDGHKTTTVLDRFINPIHVPADRRWNDIAVDLAEFNQRTVTVTLKSLPGPAANDYADWCLWGDPRIIEKAGNK